MAKKKKGTTLVELIAVMAIMGLVGSIIYTLFGGSNEIYNKVHKQTVLQDEVRLLSNTLEDDIRLGNTKNVQWVYGGTNAKFTASDGSVLTVDFSPKKVLFACERNGKNIAYVVEDIIATGKKKVTKYHCDAAGGTIEFLGFTDNIKTIECKSKKILTGSSTDVYELKMELEDRTKNTFEYEVTVYPRN